MRLISSGMTVTSVTILRLARYEFKVSGCTLKSERRCIPVREDRRFSREEITTVVAGPVSCANDGDDDEDEDWEEAEEEEEEPVCTAPDGHGR